MKLFEVSRLTRPARIRCRPEIAFRSASSLHPASSPGKVSRPPRRAEPAASLDLAPASVLVGLSGREHADYLQAVEIQKASGGSSNNKRPALAPSLPSLRKLDSFDYALRETPRAGPSTGRSAKVSPVSVKGKEKAVAPPEMELEHVTDLSHSSYRRNPVGVQLLSPSLHKQLFPGEPLPKPVQTLLNISKRHLQDHGLSPSGAAVLPEISFDMPQLQGGSIREHFHAIGNNTAEPYLSMAKDFGQAQLPDMPRSWVLDRPGWTRYRDGEVEAVADLGNETMVSFDVETLYKLSRYPCMATAVTPNAWYSWLSPKIFEAPPVTPSPSRERWEQVTPAEHPNDLIPLFRGDAPRIVIGHNVGYDRARIAEEYELKRTSTRFLDTLSLHVATRGITSNQRPAWMAYRKNKKEKQQREGAFLQELQNIAAEEGDADMLQSLVDLEIESSNEDASNAMAKTWEDVTSVNSLAEVAALHCGKAVDKSIRNRFGDDDIKHASQLRPELNELLTYCAGDVKITHEVYQKVLPLFFESCPHPASFAGMLAMGNSFLPVNEAWAEYLKNAESTYREMNENVRSALRTLADKLRRSGPVEMDPYHAQLDWTPKKARWADDPDPITTSGDTDTIATAKDDNASSSAEPIDKEQAAKSMKPAWYQELSSDPASVLSSRNQRYLIPLIARMRFKGHPVVHTAEHHWCFMVPEDQISDHINQHGAPVELCHRDQHLDPMLESHVLLPIASPGKARKAKLVGPGIKPYLSKGLLTSEYPTLLKQLSQSDDTGEAVDQLVEAAESLVQSGKDTAWGAQLDWSPSDPGSSGTSRISSIATKTALKKPTAASFGTWPKWYWDQTVAATNDKVPHGELDLTFKKIVAPLLLRLQWQGYPLFYSRQHKWVYRMPRAAYAAETSKGSRGKPVVLSTDADKHLISSSEHVFFRLPHEQGEGKPVGSPLAKSFAKYIESGDLSSAPAADGDLDAAKTAESATKLNVVGSYWMSARERIMDQMVVYQNLSAGMILPQVIPMGTVTRRAVEATWLTASNAKKNRVGSELKAMIRAPPGYAIVGADVDSEELWISSVMGDSQFGMHGASAIGWMTLEGTKSAGTDLHSKTAGILGTSRDAAKVFNYSRIYGAGQKHAVQLLLQGDPKLSKEDATAKAKSLYAATKGNKTMRDRKLPSAIIPSIWHGGSESYLFNTLEAIALSDRPMTPALGCGVTNALNKSFLDGESSYLPSRVNWVVQSSGVDYLHLLIVSMEYLLRKYDIRARYLISVHDEVRYLAKEDDRYRTALALQIANAWTRALFCYNLGMDDVPQGVTFFAAVDIDHVLRKEVFMTCETPSHPNPIPAGESFDMARILEKTGGSLGQIKLEDRKLDNIQDIGPPVILFPDIRSPPHIRFLEAQAQTRGFPSKAWLDSLPPALGTDSRLLPVKTVAQKVARPITPIATEWTEAAVRDAFEEASINPDLFQRRVQFADPER